MRYVRAALLGIVVCVLAGAANAKPPLTAFGDQPTARAADLSPDGSKLAFIARIDDVDVLSIYDFSTHTTKRIVRIPDIHARTLQFVGDNHVILIVSQTTRTIGFIGAYDFSAAFSLTLTTGKMTQLLNKTPNIYPAQSGLGRIVGVDPDGQHVYMPAYMAPPPTTGSASTGWHSSWQTRATPCCSPTSVGRPASALPSPTPGGANGAARCRTISLTA